MISSNPFWWEDAGPPAPPPQTDLPQQADLVIVGAGLTGLSAARTAAKTGAHVLVLDAGAPGIGASSRNGGMMGGGHRLSLSDLDRRYGQDLATRLLTEAYIDSFDFCRSVMEEEDIACDYRQSGRFRGFWRTAELDRAARELEALQARVPVAAQVVGRADQRGEVASDLYRGGVVYPDHGCVNPAKWTKGMLAAAQKAGAQVQGDTPVTGLHDETGDVRVETARGTVRAGAVLMATNGYSPALHEPLRRRLIPVPSFIIATEPLGENRVRALFPTGRMIVETRHRHCYYRPSPDFTRVVFGARAAMFDAPEGFALSQMRGLLAEVFPELRGVAITHSWRGNTGFTFNFLPNIGRIGGIWHAAGYCGNGNAMAPWLGHKAALAALGAPGAETAFAETGMASRWWHRGRPWFLPFADITFRLRDIENRFGRA